MNPKVITVQGRPAQCTECGGRVVNILYGYPAPDAFEMAERKEIVLGGCLINTEGDPQWACTECGIKFWKK